MRSSDWSSDVCSSDLASTIRLQVRSAYIHYVDRTWSLIVEAAGLPAREPLLKQWAVEQKRLDARECLHMAIEDTSAAPARPVMVRTMFLDWLATECAVDLDMRCRLSPRSEERRGGKECVSTCRSRWSPCH